MDGGRELTGPTLTRPLERTGRTVHVRRCRVEVAGLNRSPDLLEGPFDPGSAMRIESDIVASQDGRLGFRYHGELEPDLFIW